MSAEVLRRAASEIREDYSAEEMGMPTPDPFMHAVADWLDAYAYRAETLGHLIGGNVTQALAVALAYLGESA